jgi:hypothetical protein
MTPSGVIDPEETNKAKSGLIWSIAALILILFSYVIIKTFISLTFLGNSKSSTLPEENKKIIIYRIDSKNYKYGFRLNGEEKKDQSIYYPVISSETKGLSFEITTNDEVTTSSLGDLKCKFVSAGNSLGDLEDVAGYIEGGVGTNTTTTTTYKVLNKLLPPGKYIISCETNISVNNEIDKKHIAKILKLDVFRNKECKTIPESEASKENKLSKTSDTIKSKLSKFCGNGQNKIKCDATFTDEVKKFQKGLQPFYEKWALTPKGRYFLYDLGIIKKEVNKEAKSIEEIFNECNDIDGIYGKCTEGALRAWCQYSPKKS